MNRLRDALIRKIQEYNTSGFQAPSKELIGILRFLPSLSLDEKRVDEALEWIDTMPEATDGDNELLAEIIAFNIGVALRTVAG